ncbi:DNA polymerase I [Lachnospiraceae bacterium KM106-2]|nr:DNA polymerase I [Lachnospiraceae bacterium KM106-2]
MSKKIVLIDGHSILNRAFYGIPDLTNSEGLHTNAVYGFLNILLKILEEEQADYLTVAFDVKAPTFRHEMYDAYKGTRKGMPEELREQVPLMKEVLKAMHVTIVERPGYEADDILGTIARQAERDGLDVSLVSGDRDLLQLATEKIKIRIPKTKRGGTEIEDYHTQDVIDKYGVTPLQIIDLKGLMGDQSDNIPGVPGIGEKTATKILTQFETVENAIEHVDEIKPNKAKENLKEYEDMARMSKTLATIKTDCELDYNRDEATFDELFNEEAFVMFKRLEFKNLLNRFDQEASVSNTFEESFVLTSDFAKADQILSEAKETITTKKVSHIGISFLYEKEEILGLTICYGEEKAATILVGGMITKEYLVDHMNAFIQMEGTLSIIGLKDQLRFMDACENSPFFDCSVVAYLLNPLKDSYFYDDLARDYLSIPLRSTQELFGKKKLSEVASEENDEFRLYGGYVSYVAFKAYEPLMDALKETEMLDLFHDIEMPLVYTLWDMERRGIRVNKEALKQYGDQLSGRINELETGIYDLVGEQFNINSPKQLGVILFEKLELPFAKKTKTGYSTSADILEKLKCEHPVISMILEYRQLTKLKSTYADGLANYIHEDDSRIHGKFNQTITATGRISSTEPNLQNIPIRMELGRQIRKVFIPKDGYVFLDADYSQIELRVLAHMSGDERLIAAYHEDEDIHRITASQVFHTPLNEVTSLQRSNAKAVNFGIIYGISSFSLGQDLGITKKDADHYIKRYFETYPKVKGFLENLVSDAKEKGYVTTLYHRRRPIPELASSNFMQRAFGERIAMNSPIQGTAADIIKIAMIRVNKRLKEANMKSQLLLQIHDELLVETHESEIEQVKQIMLEEMQGVSSLAVPLEIEVMQGNNWYESK